MKGLVIKSTGADCLVCSDNKIIDCKIRGKIRLDGLRSTNPVAVGDYVEFDIDGDFGVISAILPRKNFIVRKATNLSKQKHIIASNVDFSVLIVTIKMPKTPVEFIDRFLVASMAYNVDVLLVFNKIDLLDDDENQMLDNLVDTYSKIGYSVLKTSVTDNSGIDALKDFISNKTVLISGNSGVGKTSLVEKLQPGLKLKTAEISASCNQGKHTTTFAEMYFTDLGARIIDTPGIRGFGITGMSPQDVAHNFKEFFNRLSDCKFYNCTHTHEPGCAVKQAVENGEIALSRYKSYLSIITDDDSKYRNNNSAI